MPTTPQPRLVFTTPFGERDAHECETRGFCDLAQAEFPDGSFVPLVFYDLVRLEQEMQARSERGQTWLAVPGLVVLPRVTRERMARAVEGMYREHFFDEVVARPPPGGPGETAGDRSADTGPRLVFDEGFGEREAYESEARSYCAWAQAEFPDGSFIPLYFYDPVGVSCDIGSADEYGPEHLADPALIIVERVTPEQMERAVEGLRREGYFDHLVRFPAGSGPFPYGPSTTP
ncbi:MAG: hypothetical protein H6739_39650 [Alphaproteobacteria bacterium]|nr:hypothetical protein [Alphaproteobacteria bacterium]